MSELKPCPFCGGVAARDIILEDGSNYGGEIIVCKRCLASTRVFFGEKEGLEESWNTRTPSPAEVERLVDRINDELFCGALKGETKSRLLAALTNTAPNLSGDVIVPVEELEQDLEQYITLGSTGCRTIAEDVEFNRLHSKFLAALSSGDGPVEKLEAGRYRMMIPVEISTTGGLLLDRRDGLHGYSLEDYPNARFFKGW